MLGMSPLMYTSSNPLARWTSWTPTNNLLVFLNKLIYSHTHLKKHLVQTWVLTSPFSLCVAHPLATCPCLHNNEIHFSLAFLLSLPSFPTGLGIQRLLCAASSSTVKHLPCLATHEVHWDTCGIHPVCLRQGLKPLQGCPQDRALDTD